LLTLQRMEQGTDGSIWCVEARVQAQMCICHELTCVFFR